LLESPLTNGQWLLGDNLGRRIASARGWNFADKAVQDGAARPSVEALYRALRGSAGLRGGEIAEGKLCCVLMLTVRIKATSGRGIEMTL